MSGILAPMSGLRTPSFVISFLAFSLALGACGGGGRYGYARTYEPIDGERAYMERATDASYEEVRRARPEEQPYVSWFGIALGPPETHDGVTRVRLSLRAHQERHLCDSEYADSCRVTISERELGNFTAQITMRPEDASSGNERLWQGSLVRVYGRSVGESDASGDPVIVGEWYRHWPRHTFVTTAMSGRMRR
jgi:hypothetical protein